MPVELKKVRGRLRTVEAGSLRIAMNSRTRKPIDGGKGWADTPKGRATGGRQVEHVNEAVAKKRRVRRKR